MNNQRRKKISEAISIIINAKNYLGKAKDILNNVAYEEQDAFDNLSDGLQQTIRGEQIDENASTLQDAVDQLEDIISDLNSIIL